jgi:hypothetical protein
MSHSQTPDVAKQVAAFDAVLAAKAAYRTDFVKRAERLTERLNGEHRRESLEGLRLEAEVKKALESDTKREAELISADHAAFTAEARPKALVEAWRQHLLSRLSTHRGSGSAHAGRAAMFHRLGPHLFPFPWLPPSLTQLTPPAFSCDSSGAQCDAILGDINLRVTSSGGGGAWGLLATAAGPPDFARLRFVFTPAAGGDLYVTARVDVSGTAYVVAHDHWYTSTRATARLAIGCRLFQHYQDDGAEVVVVDENRTDSSAAYWIVDSFYPTASTTVNADVPVLIDVWATLEGHGHSDHAKVDCDFASGADKRIRVPSLDVLLVPF